MAKAPPLATGRLPSLRLFSTLLPVTLKTPGEEFECHLLVSTTEHRLRMLRCLMLGMTRQIMLLGDAIQGS